MNKRHERIRGELKKEISKILLYEIKDPRLTGMPSVMNVKVSNDMSYADIYVSILGDKDSISNSLIAINNASGYIRSKLSQRLKLRYVPQLRFEIDDYIEHGIKINSIIKSLNITKADENDE